MPVLPDLTSSSAKYRIFVSYSHDSESHRSKVKDLADTLGSLPETDCVLDQYVPGEHPIEGWPRWMESQFELATRVLCICTERYAKLIANDASVDKREGRGAHWESELFLAELYSGKSASKKLKAVVFGGGEPERCVPKWLAKWGWLTFPKARRDASFKKLVAYIEDAAPEQGAGLPDEIEAVGFDPQELEYIEWLRRDNIKEVENVKLLGMAKPIRLLDIYYPTVLSTTIARRLYESEWKKADSNENGVKAVSGIHKKTAVASFVTGSEFVDRNKRVVVLGGPGAGKTTFLKSLALRYCGAIPGHHGDGGFAIFVHLPTASKSDLGLLEWIDAQATACRAANRGMFEGVASRAQATILLDSLDEVPSANRLAIVDRIRLLDRQLPNSRIVISCRTADYSESLEAFSDVEIARLSSDAISKIVPAWFPDEPANAARLLSLISSDEGVRSLTETPLLLSLLCIQFRHDLDLPKRKVELYSRCVSVLLRYWDAGRKFRPLRV